jgi:hypothetical protein
VLKSLDIRRNLGNQEEFVSAIASLAIDTEYFEA